MRHKISILASVGLFATLSVLAVSFGQSSCPPLPGKGPFSVPGGTKVYYKMNLSGLANGADGSNPANEVTQAIAAWNAANQASGNNTQFLPAGSGDPVDINFTSDSDNTGGSATTSAGNGLIDGSNPATVSFHPNSTFSGTSTRLFQPSQAGYNTAYLQSALHEIGHLMGIGDYGVPADGNVTAPPPGSSVMNNFYGVNDTGINPPLKAPTTCDAAAAAKDSHVTLGPAGGGAAPPPPKSIPPTGSGGGGGGNTSCGGGSYFDPDTNTVYGWC